MYFVGMPEGQYILVSKTSAEREVKEGAESIRSRRQIEGRMVPIKRGIKRTDNKQISFFGPETGKDCAELAWFV
jgi:hypothetical protein